MNNNNILRLEMRRKFKAAVYVVFLVQSIGSSQATPKERKVGQKYNPRRVNCGEEMKKAARRRMRAAVYAILAAQAFQKTKYVEPIFDWEDTTIPPVAPKIHRESSLQVEEAFAIYQEEVERMKQRVATVVMAVMGAQELNLALGISIHPRYWFRGIEFVRDHLMAVNLSKEEKEEEQEQDDAEAAAAAVLSRNKSTLQKCHQHRVLRHQVRLKLDWLGTHIPRRHRYGRRSEQVREMKDKGEPTSPVAAKRTWTPETIAHTAE